MPELAYRVPQYRRHRASGQAIVKLSGKTYYLGPHGTEASRAEYDRLVAEWMRNGRRFQRGSTDITVNELLLAYWRFAEGYYRQDGQPTSELNAIRIACRPLRRLYGSTQARDFGPLALKVVREAMVSRGWVRTSVNHHIVRIRRLFKWAAENEMIPPDVHSALTKVSGLKRGRTAAPESSPVRPVPAAHVAAVLPHVSAQVRAMIEILRLTAMRPAEVTLLRTADLQRGAPVWTYTLARHKLTHLGRPRAVYLGPQAQEVIRPFLKLDANAYLFDPRDAEQDRNASRTRDRKTPRWPSHLRFNAWRRARQARHVRRRPIGTRYTTAALRRAIERACDKAAVPRWTPGRLRHTRATEIRRTYGLDATRAVLGHSSAATTEIYAEVDRAQAIAIMAEIG